jgi:hypothetical protein
MTGRAEEVAWASFIGRRRLQQHQDAMPRRSATITQADAARIIRAAKQAGAPEVEVRIGNAVVVVRLADRDRPLDPEPQVVL